MNPLKEYLLKRPNIKAVYFNEAGDYLFHASKGFDKVVSREEIMDEGGLEKVKDEEIKPVENEVENEIVLDATEEVKVVTPEGPKPDIKNFKGKNKHR